MNDFKLDTSGVVTVLHPRGADVVGEEIRWPDLSPFEQGYVEEMLKAYWEDCIEQASDYGQPMKRAPFGFSDLAPETLERIREDCAAAMGANQKPEDGAAFWRVRNNHPEYVSSVYGDRFPLLTLYLSDDGKLHFR